MTRETLEDDEPIGKRSHRAWFNYMSSMVEMMDSIQSIYINSFLTPLVFMVEHE